MNLSRTFKQWFAPLFIGCAAILVGADILAPRLLGGHEMIGRLFLPFGAIGLLGIVVNAVLERREGRPVLHRLWPLVVVALMIAKYFGPEISQFASAVFQQLTTSRLETDGIRFARADDGQFHWRAMVDGGIVDFEVSPEVSDIVLTPSDAKRIGIDPSSLTFNLRVETADGADAAASVRLRNFQIGSHVILDLPAKVSATGKSGNVLGKALFDRLSEWQIEGDTLMVLP